MSGIIKAISSMNKIPNIKKIIPIAFSVLISILQVSGGVVKSFQEMSIKPAIQTFASVIFAADYNITQQVNIAMITPEAFTLFNILTIISSLLVLSFWIIAVQNIIAFLLTNTSAKGIGTIAISLFIIGVIEIVAIVTTFGKFIIPFSGVVTLLFNIPTIINVVKLNFASTWDFLYNNI